MKKLIFSIAIFISSIQAHSQDSLKYDYAMLHIDLSNDILSVRYSNGPMEYLIQKLNIQRKELKQSDAIIFRCFQYLNDKGYDMISYRGSFLAGDKEYLFKKKVK